MSPLQISLGRRGFRRLGLLRTSCVEPFYALCFPLFSIYFSSLGEYCNSVGRNVLRTTRLHPTFPSARGWADNDWIFNFGWTYPLNSWLLALSWVTGKVVPGTSCHRTNIPPPPHLARRPGCPTEFWMLCGFSDAASVVFRCDRHLRVEWAMHFLLLKTPSLIPALELDLQRRSFVHFPFYLRANLALLLLDESQNDFEAKQVNSFTTSRSSLGDWQGYRVYLQMSKPKRMKFSIRVLGGRVRSYRRDGACPTPHPVWWASAPSELHWGALWLSGPWSAWVPGRGRFHELPHGPDPSAKPLQRRHLRLFSLSAPHEPSGSASGAPVTSRVKHRDR